MQERHFKAKRHYLWVALLCALFLLNPFFKMLKVNDFNSLVLVFLLMLGMLSLMGFFVSLIFQDLVLTEKSLRWNRVFFPKTVKELFLDDVLHIEVCKIDKNRQLHITTKAHKMIIISDLLYDNFDELVSALGEKQSTEFATVIPDSPMLQDIGNRPTHLIILAAVLFVCGLLADNLLIQAWHCSSENMFSWLLISLPLSVLLAYGYIHSDKKAMPVFSAIFSGVLLGAALNFDFLIANRLVTESHSQPSYQSFHFMTQSEHYQKWQPLDQQALVFHDGYFQIFDVWREGYNPDLQAGSNYKIAVMQGALNDIAFPIEAFKNPLAE